MSFPYPKNRWQLKATKTPTQELIQAVGGSPVLAQLLTNRGHATVDSANAFLNLENYIPASAWDLPDMAEGIDRTLAAIAEQQPILIYGDFDVDGQTGTSILLQALRHLGAKVSFYVPDRVKEGHGMNVAALCRLVSSRQIKLVITTDTGITNFNEVNVLKSLGVDTIITDHHELPENLPLAVANLNPKRLTPDHALFNLSGAGVAYLFCDLLLEAKGDKAYSEKLLDLCAIGMVADLMPLTRDNRYLVWRGLQVLQKRERLGLKEILREAGVDPEKQLTSETVGFTIGPRLNAIGRLANATEAVELLTTEDPERAVQLAAHLEHLNRKRQELCEKTTLEAESHLNMIGGLNGNKAIILGSPDWLPGIVGIVASRLIDQYHVPTFMMVHDEENQEARCSARSIPGFDIHDALLQLEHYFTRFGGHAGAAGFSLPLSKLNAFKQDLYAVCHARITDEMVQPVVEPELSLAWSQISPQLMDWIDQLAPYGQENPAPLFLIEGARIGAQRKLGSDENHLKLILNPPQNQMKPGQQGSSFDALIWRYGSQTKGFTPNGTYDFVVSLARNDYQPKNGSAAQPIQLMIEDARVHGEAHRVNQLISTTPTLTQTTPTTLSTTLTTPQPTSSQSPQDIWIDHRGREAVADFVSQFILANNGGSSKKALYHEGRPPQLPFLDPATLIQRYPQVNLPSSSIQESPMELVLWDIPPLEAELKALLNHLKPNVIHLVGGKYQTTPMQPESKGMMKLIYQALRSEAQTQQTQTMQAQTLTIELTPLASKLATSEDVILNGLVLLSRLGFIQTSHHNGHMQATLQPGSSTPAALEELAFERALQAVSHFRQWMMTQPLAAIEDSFRFNRQLVPVAAL